MIESFMLILLLNCCGPNAVVNEVVSGMTEEACHERGIVWVHTGESRGFMCLKEGRKT